MIIFFYCLLLLDKCTRVPRVHFFVFKDHSGMMPKIAAKTMHRIEKIHT